MQYLCKTHQCKHIMDENKHIIEQTKIWLKEIVIGFNFCPFANPVFKEDKIDYVVTQAASELQANAILLQTINELVAHPERETALLIFSNYLQNFSSYLAYLKKANALLQRKKMNGKFQLASFHPDYVFDGLSADDAANFTNRAPFPILHIIREDSLTKALKTFPSPEKIPDRNIALARNKGLLFFQDFMNNIKTKTT